ncbi:MAG TPA: hypothetical protein DCZ95_16810 [Verrucomicrobia bacterium]|nr:MAG: hypothetical protein A2X46_09300 [Lentisphaerae bacterium GWF2_57_35]HBA85745.1 hypothetical protein [Verrucomicrobiota bacterium]
MTDATKNDSPKVNVLILSVHQELGETFLQSVCAGAAGTSGETIIENRPIRVEVLAGDSRLNPSWDETIRKSDAVALLVRFMDAVSMEKIRAIYRRLPGEKTPPIAVYLFREEGEIDFKVSCPSCGQKLWVRDSDVNKRGRCPNCKKAFKLPSQAGHLKSQLMLPDAVPATTVVRGNSSSCRGAVASLLAYVTGHLVVKEGALLDQETLKKTTVRVQVTAEG